jgi:hypothetical protein
MGQPAMSTSSGATQLRLVARLRHAEGSWWPFEVGRIGAHAILADGQEHDRDCRERGNGGRRESCQGNRTDASAAGVAGGSIPAHIGTTVVCLRVMVGLAVYMHVGDALVVTVSGSLVHGPR